MDFHIILEICNTNYGQCADERNHLNGNKRKNKGNVISRSPARNKKEPYQNCKPRLFSLELPYMYLSSIWKIYRISCQKRSVVNTMKIGIAIPSMKGIGFIPKYFIASNVFVISKNPKP